MEEAWRNWVVYMDKTFHSMNPVLSLDPHRSMYACPYFN